MLTHHVDHDHKLIEVTIAGKISREDLTSTLAAIEEPVQEWDKINILKRVDSFKGMEWGALVDDIKFALQNAKHYKKIKKVALVSDKDWIETIAKMTKGLIAAEFKIFDAEDIEEAREWLR